MHKRPERSHMQRSRFVEPHMPVDARPFIKPPLFERSVGADGYQILTAIVQVFRDVIRLCGITARLVSQIDAVYPDTGITENAVELKIVFRYHPTLVSGYL